MFKTCPDSTDVTVSTCCVIYDVVKDVGKKDMLFKLSIFNFKTFPVSILLSIPSQVPLKHLSNWDFTLKIFVLQI